MVIQEVLFRRGDLRSWLEQRIRTAVDEVGRVRPDEVLARPHEQLAEEIIERHLVPEPSVDEAGMTGNVTDQPVDVSHDFLRAVYDRTTPTLIPGSRITLTVPFAGLAEVLQLRASTSTTSPPRAYVSGGQVSVFADVPADIIEREREGVVAALRSEIRKITAYLGYSCRDIAAANDRLRADVRRAAAARRAKILADHDTEAILGRATLS